MSFSLYVGVALFGVLALLIGIWSFCQFRNQKAIEEMFNHNEITDPRNGIFYVASQYSSGRVGFPYDHNYGPGPYETSGYHHERQIEYSTDSVPNFNAISRSISPAPPHYETLEIPPSYEECSKLGYA